MVGVLGHGRGEHERATGDRRHLAFPSDGAAPLDKLAGLPLALRTVLTLQKEGAKTAWVLGPEADTLVARFALDSRVKIAMRAVASASAKEGFEALRADVNAPSSWGCTTPSSIPPSIAPSPPSRAAKRSPSSRRAKSRVGPFLGTPALLADLGAESFDLALTQLLAEGSARRLEIGKSYAYRVTTPEGRKLAFRALFEACRKPVDGIVARNLNRHISIFISKRIVGLPLTPNMLSFLTFLLGVGGAISCARGGYFPMLLGAFLFQWNSILDGVDGELARVRFQHSKLGQWLDTVSDDVSNVMFYAGLAIGAQSLPYGSLLAMCGWIAIVTFTLASAQFYVEMAALGTGDLYAIDWGFDKKPPAGVLGKLLLFFRNALKKDFAILFFLVLALFGVLPYALPVIAGSAIGNLIAATLRNVRKRRAKRAAALA